MKCYVGHHECFTPCARGAGYTLGMVIKEHTLPDVLKAPPPATEVLSGDPSSIEHEAMGIRAQLQSSDQEQTRQLIQRLQGLSARIPQFGTRGRRAAGVVAMVLAQAKTQMEDQVSSEIVLGNPLMNAALQLSVYYTMNEVQKQVYQQIDKKAEYELVKVDEKGRICSDDEPATVKGETLREEMSLIQYHSLKEDEKKQLISKTFGMDAPDDEQPKTQELLRAEQEGLQKLHKALRNMEAYHAAMQIHKGAGIRFTLGAIASNHEIFARAHAQVDALHAAYEALAADPANESLKAQLVAARRSMKQTLKHDIMDGVMTGGGGSAQPVALPNVGSIVSSVGTLLR